MDHCQLRFLDVTFLAIKGYLLLQLSRSIPVFLPIQKYPFRSDFRHDDTLKALLSWATSLVWKKNCQIRPIREEHFILDANWCFGRRH